MQAPNAQGLAGLMSQGRAPQATPQPAQGMPSPTKASPMAGLGSVEDRVAAYRGNPAPLQQRYQMSQDLLDLLALQKIKSEKEAAARQMQLAMGQQAAAQGAEPPTVAQQREKEVLDMTKNELAQQRGATAAKQTEDQQRALQQAMQSGIAGAPGAATAAQPKAMATGGIVAFAGDDERVGSSVPDPDEGAQRGKVPTEEEVRVAYRRWMDAKSPWYLPTPKSDPAKDREREYTELLQAYQMGRPVAAPPPAMPAAPAVAPAPTPRPEAPAAIGMPAAPSAAPATSRVPAAPSAGAAPVAPSAAAAPAQDGLLGLGAQLGPLAMEQAKRNEVNEGLAEEQRVEKRRQLTPEQRAVYDEGIAGLRKMYEQQYDPERQSREGLKQFLIGAGGRRYNEFGGGAATAMGYDEAQRQAKLKDFADLQKARTGLVDLERKAVEEGIAAGRSAREQAAQSKRTGLESATGLYRIAEDVRNRALDRDIERIKASISAEANRISKQGMRLDAARAFLERANNNIATQEQKINKRYAEDPRLGMISMKDPSTLTDAEKQTMRQVQLERDREIATLNARLRPVIEDAERQLGLATSDAFGELRAVKK